MRHRVNSEIEQRIGSKRGQFVQIHRSPDSVITTHDRTWPAASEAAHYPPSNFIDAVRIHGTDSRHADGFLCVAPLFWRSQSQALKVVPPVRTALHHMRRRHEDRGRNFKIAQNR